jgi:hypothetical protein
MRELIIATDSIDREHTFRIDTTVTGTGRRGGRFPATCTLHSGYQKQGDGVYWALQGATVIAAHYSEREIAERDRLNSEDPIKNGEVVLIDGAKYTTFVLGDFSNCAIFVPEDQHYTIDRWGNLTIA